MPTPLLITLAILLPIDAALRPWRPLSRHGITNTIYLLLAYVPMLVLPLLGALGVTLLIGFLSVYSLFNYSRMVGLTTDRRFFLAALISTVAFFGAARAHWYGLFQAMPAFAVCLVVATAAARADPRGFLQKLCLAWLGLLVYGYLAAHAALFCDLQTHPVAFSGGLGIAQVILIAKFADIPWVLVRRLPGWPSWLQLIVSPVGGALGAMLIGHVQGADLLPFAGLGLVAGAGLAFASRAYDLIVIDVLGTPPDRPLKGTMLFGFCFALVLAYHYVRFMWTGAGPVLSD